MSEVENALVKRGFWVNWSDGAVLGATITTTSQGGNVVVAALAVLVAVAGGHLWSLVVFAYHQSMAGRASADGLYRQQQVLLCTLPAPGPLLVDFIKLGAKWRKIAPRAVLRNLIPCMLAAVFGLLTLTAGLFSSYAVQLTDLDILVDGGECLMWDSALGDPSSNGQVELSYDVNKYARNCYKADGSIPSQCNVYPYPRIQSTKSYGPCPFGTSICASVDKPALMLDTGFLDSRDVFGVNTKDEDRVRFRKKTACVPINPMNFTMVINPLAVNHSILTYPPFGDEMIWLYNFSTGYRDLYGPALTGVTIQFGTAQTNATSSYTTAARWHPVNTSVLGNGNFDPVDALLVDDSDVNLIFIFSNAARYPEPIDDPVFAAHKAHTFKCTGCVDAQNSSEVLNITMYLPDYPAGILGCIEQYQYCTGEGLQSQCSALTGSMSGNIENTLPHANEMQLAVANLLANASQWATISSAGNQDPPFLNATSLSNSVIDRSEQWQIEVQTMDSWVWAAIQTYIARFATGFARTDSTTLLSPSKTTADQQLCKIIRLRKSGGFANINVFSLAFVVAVAALLALADMVVLKGLVFLPPLRRRLEPRITEWVNQGALQLQRRAYQARDEGIWHRLDREVPVTAKGDMLSKLESQSVSVSRPSMTSACTAVLQSPKRGGVASTHSTASLQTSSQASNLPTNQSSGHRPG